MNINWNDPNFQGFAGARRRAARPKKVRKSIGSPLGRTLINLAVTLVFGLIYFYAVLPPISLQAPEFYVFALLLCAVYCVCAVLTSGFQGEGPKGCEEAVPRAVLRGGAARGCGADRCGARLEGAARGRLPRPADR